MGFTITPPVPSTSASLNDNDFVVEIIRKIQVIDKKAPAGYTYTAHEYEGRIIKNFSRPEIVFEYEEDEAEGDDG